MRQRNEFKIDDDSSVSDHMDELFEIMYDFDDNDSSSESEDEILEEDNCDSSFEWDEGEEDSSDIDSPSKDSTVDTSESTETDEAKNLAACSSSKKNNSLNTNENGDKNKVDNNPSSVVKEASKRREGDDGNDERNQCPAIKKPKKDSDERSKTEMYSTDESDTASEKRDSNEDEEKDPLADFDEENEDDETVCSILSRLKKKRLSPPEIKTDDFITDICFHPEREMIAVATIIGDVCLYEYSDDGNQHLNTVEVHSKSCRDVEFSMDGFKLLTCSKDKSIVITDMESQKLLKFTENAHDEAINRLHVVDDHIFASGDDVGMVKLWDLRMKDEIFALKEVNDYVTDLYSNTAGKLLLVTSGDGHLATLNIGARKLYVRSEPYEEELTSMNIFRGDSKLVVGTSRGNLYTFNWGQFGYHSDKFPGVKSPINHMLAITDRIGCVGGEDGKIWAMHVAPFRLLGVVGHHNMPIESMDISWNGELVATSSHNNDLRFWNVKYFEDFADVKYNEKHNLHKERAHNLPSSNYSNAGDFFADLN